MTRAWPLSRMAPRIAVAAFWAAAFPSEFLSSKTLNTISWLLSPVIPTASRRECWEIIQELEPPQAAPMRLENGMRLKARLVLHPKSQSLGARSRLDRLH